jgi:hypothetical protein
MSQGRTVDGRNLKAPNFCLGLATDSKQIEWTYLVSQD